MTDTNIKNIAIYAGVSVSTVSRVINNHPDVSPATRKKVLATIEEYGYIPNDSARNLKRESMKAVGVIVKGFSNPFFTGMLTIIQKEFDDNKYTTLLRQIDPKENEIDAAISLVKEKKPRGLIFLGGNFDQKVEKLKLLDIPYVMTTISPSEGINRDNFSSIAVDDFEEAKKVTERIITAGHKKIGAIGFREADTSISKLRISGFSEALKNANIQKRKIEYAGEFSLSAGYDAAKRLLENDRPTCIFCISDIIAIGAIRAIHDSGLKIPEDISVIGFDGIEQGKYSIPSLATVKQPDEKMAYKSVQIILDCLRKIKTVHKHIILDAKFQEGESFKSLNE